MIQPKKSLGQHFLRDPNTIRKIAQALAAPSDAVVIEIGPGTGVLTRELAGRFERLIAVEVDQRAVAHLEKTLPDVTIIHADVLSVDWRALAEEHGEKLWVIGNLPYYITSPILFGLLDARDVIRQAVLMMQKEVAQRLVATHGTKVYGILSVQTQLLSAPSLLFTVGRNVFHPKPDVDSAVVRLDFGNEEPDVPVELLRKVVRTAFNQRRKTLRNSLKTIVEEMNVSLLEDVASLRPEALTPMQFVELTRSFLKESPQ